MYNVPSIDSAWLTLQLKPIHFSAKKKLAKVLSTLLTNSIVKLIFTLSGSMLTSTPTISVVMFLGANVCVQVCVGVYMYICVHACVCKANMHMKEIIKVHVNVPYPSIHAQLYSMYTI